MSIYINTIKREGYIVNPPTWDDIRVPVSSVKTGGSKDPDFTIFKKDAAGTSQGVFLYWFDDSAEEELYFAVQLPHGYKYGTNLHPHVHWAPKVNGSAGQVVNWGMEYVWQSLSGVFSPTTIIYNNIPISAPASLVADTHYLTELGVISGTGMESVSSMLICRVFRDATGALGTDDFADDAGLLEIDFHFQSDTEGSATEYEK